MYMCTAVYVVRMGEAIQTSAPSLNLFFLLYFLIFFGGSNSLSIPIYTARVAAAADGSICAFPSFPYVFIRDPQKKGDIVSSRQVRENRSSE